MIKNSSLSIRPGIHKDFPLYEQWYNSSLEFPKIIKKIDPHKISPTSLFQELLIQDPYLTSKFYVIEAELSENSHASKVVPLAQVHLELLTTTEEEDSKLNPTYEFYLFLHPEFRGKGLGKKVIRLAAKFLINETKIKKLSANIHRRNTQAILCFSKAKFQFERTTTYQHAYCQEYKYPSS